MGEYVRGKRRPLKEWEKDYLIENYGKLTFSEMAEHIGVGSQYVSNRLVEMGIHEKQRKIPTGDELIKLKDIDNQLSLQIGKTYNVKENSDYPVKEDLFAELTRIDGRRKFEGKLIDVTKDLLVFDNGRYVESVRKVDFLTGDYEVIK